MSAANRVTAYVLTMVLLSLASTQLVFAQHGGAAPTTPHAADNAEGAGPEHGEGGYIFTGDLEFWHGLAFVGFVLVLWKMDLLNGIINALFTPVGEHERQAVESLANAERITAEAQDVLRKNRGRIEALDETIQEVLEEAQRDAAHVRSAILKGAETEAAAIVDRSGQEINTVKDQTLHDIFDSLATKVAEATEARLRARLESSDQDRLINETLVQFSSTAARAQSPSAH